MVRPYLYDQYSVDDYPLGTNAVVAVISYTVSRHTVIWCVLNACQYQRVCPAQGYDMEDAMILNKASFERGFAHASVYKCEVGRLLGACLLLLLLLLSTS